MRRRYPQTYKPAGKDSDRAKASATMFLCGARSIDHVTVDSLAADYRLSPKVAELLLIQTRQRRERQA